LLRFLILIAIIVIYIGFLVWQYGFVTGGIVAILTWSFFVLCTPVADAGFLLDFPLRVLFRVRMLYSELVVWLTTVTANVVILNFAPEKYDTNFLTQLFKSILTQPYPYWGIIVLSTIGTFLSVAFGDELLDVIHHRDRELHHAHHQTWHILATIVVFILVLVGYDYLLNNLASICQSKKLQSGSKILKLLALYFCSSADWAFLPAFALISHRAMADITQAEADQP
jgi:hypothetical protein